MSEIFTGNFEYPEWYHNIPDGTSVDTHEIAKRMCVEPKTVIDWIKKGRLKATQSGGPGSKYIVAKEKLGEFLKSEAVTPDRFKELKEILDNSDKEHPEKPKVTVQSEPKNQGISFSRKRWEELKSSIDNISLQIRALNNKVEMIQNQMVREPKIHNGKRSKISSNQPQLPLS